MVGAKQFNTDAVLDRAMEVFWQKGYEATSIQDLENATGLGRGSLYNAFKDKESLFLAILGRYGGRYAAPPLKHLDEIDIGLGLKQVLTAQVERMEDPSSPRGCLTMNSCVAEVESAAIGERVTGAVRSMEGAFTAAFERAKTGGQISATTDTRQLARFYCGIMVSIAVLHKAHSDRSTLEDIVEVAMRVWPNLH